MITGGVVSAESPGATTVIVYVLVPTFPAASVAVQVTVVTPIGNPICAAPTSGVPPGGTVHSDVTTPTLSVD